MYKIIGADQKEYGPISAEQLRQWIAQGRANASTMAQPEGSAEWKPLNALPEFAASFIRNVPPSTPPIVSAVDAEKLANEILARDYNLDIGRCLERAWTLLKADFWPIIGVSALLLLVIGASNAAYIGLVLNGPLLGGLYWYYFKKIRGERAEVSDAFAGFTLAFLQLFLGSLVSSLLMGVGFIFCILPGIYLAIAWQFTLPLVIDKRIDFWPAMELSRKVISKHWWSFLGFAIVMGLVNVIGVLACCVGVFVTAPLTMIALLYAYEDIFRAPVATPAPTV
ncbi:MAG: GYF domain-containing protein [Verrucomicrobiota bacterium]